MINANEIKIINATPKRNLKILTQCFGKRDKGSKNLKNVNVFEFQVEIKYTYHNLSLI